MVHYRYNNTPDEISTVDTNSLKNSSKCPRMHTPCRLTWRTCVRV